jgi:iron complex outermembrane recepter protein
MVLADASGRVEDSGHSAHDTILPAYDYFDVSALFKVGKGYVFRAGVNNVFDREPPIFTQNTGACWGGCNGNTYPQ